jgi:catechol 2,3-dioxygenase-like lactoylglutathione lyase family enzyme
MAFVGIDAVVYGVTDIRKGLAAFQDFGLKKIKGGAKEGILETQDGSRVILRPRGDKSLPKAIQPGPTVREIVWGVEKATDLARIRRELEKDRTVTADKDGTLHSVDDIGLGIAFRKTRRRKLKTPAPTPINAPEAVVRYDDRATYYDKANPRTIGHAVFTVPDFKKAQRFYEKRLGFAVSDYYSGRGVFMRCKTPGGHHNLFFLEDESGKTQINHVAFGVSNTHELFAGGIHFASKGWKTAVGPGRHIVSSCYFWYFKNPCGGNIEYFVDEDFCTENWKPKRWNPAPHMFAEWALGDGLKKFGGQPPTRTKGDMKKAKGRKKAASA